MRAVKILMLLIPLALGCQTTKIDHPCERAGHWDGLSMRQFYKADVRETFAFEDGKATRGLVTLARLRELERYCDQMRQE
jgi:hypothetical protein